MNHKEITVIFYGCRFPREDWRFDLDKDALDEFFNRMREELSPFGIRLETRADDEIVMDIRGYGDLASAVRIRSPQDNISNLCLGHIIGPSPNRDLFEDIRRGINRVAFAPETIEPEGSNKIVCHNCGCGC
jgi:hypothetical protein